MDRRNSSRRSFSVGNSPARKTPGSFDASANVDQRLTPSRSLVVTSERTVKRLRLSKALTLPDGTTIYEACKRMAARKVDAVLLTDSSSLLCGILTDKDITKRIVAQELKPQDTPVSKVMTKNPVFVLSDTLAVEALQKMVQGKFRHLPVVQNGEVIALLDIAKCLYDAIARMERVSEKGKAIAAAVEGIEKHWGTSVAGPNTFIETLRERMFRPSLSTIISENPKIVTVSPRESVLTAARKMLDGQMSSAVVVIGNKPQGILTSRDILMRVVSKNLSPDSTYVDQVMTPNPECGTLDTSILDALHIMHDGKFLNLPVLDRDGNIISIVDVLHITNAAVSTVEGTGGVGNESTISMMQKFWDTAMAIGPGEDDDARSDGSVRISSDGADIGASVAYPASGLETAFAFKIEDKRGRMHRFNCDTRSLTHLITAILNCVGNDINLNHLPLILYEDEDHDKVVLASDNDLTVAVDHAKQAGWAGLRLYLDYSGKGTWKKGNTPAATTEFAQREAWATAYRAVAAGAALVVGLGMLAYLKRSRS